LRVLYCLGANKGYFLYTADLKCYELPRMTPCNGAVGYYIVT